MTVSTGFGSSLLRGTEMEIKVGDRVMWNAPITGEPTFGTVLEVAPNGFCFMERDGGGWHGWTDPGHLTRVYDVHNPEPNVQPSKPLLSRVYEAQDSDSDPNYDPADHDDRFFIDYESDDDDA